MAFMMRKIVVREVVPSAARRSSSRAARLRWKSWLRRERYLAAIDMTSPGTITTHDITTLVIVPSVEGVRLVAGATTMRSFADGHESRARTDPVSTRVLAQLLRLELTHGKKIDRRKIKVV